MSYFKTDKVEYAVWIAAILYTYDRFQLYTAQNAHKSLSDFYINTHAVAKKAYHLLEHEHGGLIFLNAFIGNQLGSKYNYLFGDENKVRLSKLNEFWGNKVCPSMESTNQMLETMHGSVHVEDLIEWYTYEYNVLK